MNFHATPLEGAYVIELNLNSDDRGFFARLFCREEFANVGLETQFVQINNSFTRQRGTLRGMHYQLPPAAEVKVVRCVRGGLYDVVADLRPDSPSFGRWFATKLTAENRTMMYVPRGCAHGFLTLENDTEALYLVGAYYSSERERGLRFDNSLFRIEWPATPADISEKDRQWPDYDPEFHGAALLRGLR